MYYHLYALGAKYFEEECLRHQGSSSFNVGFGRGDLLYGVDSRL
jgi:hypothetical protein